MVDAMIERQRECRLKGSTDDLIKGSPASVLKKDNFPSGWPAEDESVKILSSRSAYGGKVNSKKRKRLRIKG